MPELWQTANSEVIEMAYVTLDDVKGFLGVSGTGDDTLILALIDAAQEMVDQFCDRCFEASVDEVRVFDCVYPTVIGRDLFLDADLCAVTEVVNGDGSVVMADEYVTQPVTPPFFALRLLDASQKVWTYAASPDGALQVTGRWAATITPPPVVVHATRELVAWLYRSYDRQGGGEQGTAPAAPMAAPLPAVVTTLLEPWRRVA